MRSLGQTFRWGSIAFATLVGFVSTSGTACADETGLREGTRVAVVTSLADSGPGTLRVALAQTRPLLIVFGVGGYIALKSDLPIEKGGVIIAGETAPGTGIVLRGATLRIRSGDVEIRHIAVFPGATTDPKIGESRDAISLFGSPSKQNNIRNVLLRHISAGWGVDENIGIQGLVDGVRIERALVAEGLMRGGHPKGVHSMNLVAGNSVRRVEIYGSLFATSNQRSGRFTQGNLVSFVNNYIYGFGRASTHIDSTSQVLHEGAIDVIGNAYEASVDSTCNLPIVQISRSFFTAVPPTRVYLADNHAVGERERCIAAIPASVTAQLAPTPTHSVVGWRILPSAKVRGLALAYAGARPRARNPIDERILRGVTAGTARLIRSEADVGGYPPIEEMRKPLPPSLRDGLVLRSRTELAAAHAALCQLREEVGEIQPCLDGER